MSTYDVSEMWDMLQDMYGVSEETLQVATDIMGYDTDTMEAVLYSVTGLNSFDQVDDEDNKEDE